MPIIKKNQTAEEFETLIERYKIQNPVKFAAKEKVLMERLAALKGVAPKKEAPKKEAPEKEAPKK